MTKFRKLAMLVAAIVLSFVSTSVLAADGGTKDRLIYSLDTGLGTTGGLGGIGNPIKQDFDVAMRISDKRFVGMTISAIRVPIDNVTGISHLKVWLTKELTLEVVDGKKVNVPDILSQDVEMAQGWIEVPLEKPYTITDEGVYVGYSFSMDELNASNRRPVRITTECHEGGLFMHSARSYRKWTDVSDQCSTLLQAELDGAPQNAATALAGLTTYFGATDIENYATFYVENHGAKGVKSIDYSYVYNGQTYTGTADISPALSSVYGVQSSFLVTLPAVAEKNYYPVDLTITKVNGCDNEETDNSVTKEICIFDKVPKHRAVLEEYTGTWCGFCPRGYVGLAAMSRLHPDDFIALSYHNTSDATDPMEVMEGIQFPSNISGFPAAWLDRAYQCDAYGGFNSQATDLEVEDAWKAVCGLLAEANVDVKASLNADKTAVDATATISFPLEMKNARYGVEFVLVADQLTGEGNGWAQKNYYEKGKYGTNFSEPEFKQFVTGGSYVSGLKYDDVVVATTRLTGDNQYLPESLDMDRNYGLNASFTLSKVRNTKGENIIQNPDNLRVVALLIDYNDGTVVNAAKTARLGGTSGIEGISSEADSTPVAIYDLSGRRLSSMQQGLNIVKTADGHTSKIVIK